MDAPNPTPRWTPALAATMIVRFVGAVCLALGTFWLLDWVVYRVQYGNVQGAQFTQDLGYAVWSVRYLIVGGLLLLFEPAFARWLAGGRLGGGNAR